MCRVLWCVRFPSVHAQNHGGLRVKLRRMSKHGNEPRTNGPDYLFVGVSDSEGVSVLTNIGTTLLTISIQQYHLRYIKCNSGTTYIKTSVGKSETLEPYLQNIEFSQQQSALMEPYLR